MNTNDKNGGHLMQNDERNIREVLRGIFEMFDQLDREEQERIRRGLHPLFGLGEPLLTAKRDLGASLETTSEESLDKLETQYLVKIHELLTLMRQAKASTPEDTESLDHIIRSLSIGVEHIETSRRPENSERVQAVIEDLRRIIAGLRKRIVLLDEYHAIQFPE